MWNTKNGLGYNLRNREALLVRRLAGCPRSPRRDRLTIELSEIRTQIRLLKEKTT